MKTLKKILKIVAIIIVVVFVLGWLYSKYASPKYSGQLKIKNLSSKVSVYYDEVGVPHINAQSQKDAMVALGYVHAQDRLWQMELMRRIAAGRLSEIFGKDLVEVDLFFGGLGIEEAAEKAIKNLDTASPAYILSQAYLDGINQYLETGKTPVEFYMVGVEKEAYTLKDVYNVFGYMAFSFAAAHKTDPLFTEVKEKLGAPYLEELMGAYSKNLTINKTHQPEEITTTLSNKVNAIMKNLPIPPFVGSNSWVIALEKAKNGKVIFANDPHIGYAQPSVWYQNHIKTPDYEVYGFNIALMPFPLLGHNKEYAYGLTMLGNDDLNFYIEQENHKNSLEYLTEKGYKDYEIRDKRIKVKGESDTVFQVKISRHGPIMNGLIKGIQDERPIAMDWIYTKLPNELLEACYGISHATSIMNFKQAVTKIHAPGLNVMYGDAKNNIAWFSSAKLYQLRDSLCSRTYLNGFSGKDEILEYLPFDENPQAINPPQNYVYSANNQPDSVRGKLYPGYYQPEDRAKRITQLLDSKNDFTKEDVAKMILDVTSSTISDHIKNLLEHINQSKLSNIEQKAFSELKKWDGTYLKSSKAATIYNRFLYEFLVATYKDELGDSFNLFINTQLQSQVLPSQIANKNSIWWDNITTEEIKESRKEIIQSAFDNAIAFLQNQLGNNIDDWTWNNVISVEHEHAIGKAGGVLRKLFNVGPFQTVGGNEVINNQSFNLNETGIYKVKSGPSSRRIIDFSDVENSLTIIPTGQSGNVFSRFYKDQAQKFLEGEFTIMKLNPQEIEKTSNILILNPDK